MAGSDAAKLFAVLASQGLRLEVVGDKIRYAPKELMTADLAGRIADLKPQLRALLNAKKAEGAGELGPRTVHESAPLLPVGSPPGTPPQRACNGCAGRGFHQVGGGPEWICDTCHLPFAGAEVVATWTAPDCSVFEAMRGREGQVERTGTRGLGKRKRKPGRSAAPGGGQA